MKTPSLFSVGGVSFSVVVVDDQFFVTCPSRPTFAIVARKATPAPGERVTATGGGWKTCWARPDVFHAAVAHLASLGV